MSTTEQVQAAFREQTHEATVLAREALSSSDAAFYPIKGIYHLFSHPRLTKPIRRPLFLSLALSVVTVVGLFAFTYVPQALALTLFNGPLAFVTVIPLILGEASFIVNTVARMFFLGPALQDTFDGVLLENGLTALVSKGREIKPRSHGKELGRVLGKPLEKFSKEAIIRYIVSAPLNAIPVVGPAIFLLYNGARSGPSYHSRYFQLKGFTPAQRESFIKQRRGAYVSFGTATQLLSPFPFVSLALQFSNTAGAALWASDVEKLESARRDIIDSDEPRGPTRKRKTGAGTEL